MADLQNVAYGVSVEDRRYGLPRFAVNEMEAVLVSSKWSTPNQAGRKLLKTGAGEGDWIRDCGIPWILAIGIAGAGYRTLAVDLDQRGNLSTALGVHLNNLSPTTHRMARGWGRRLSHRPTIVDCSQL